MLRKISLTLLSVVLFGSSLVYAKVTFTDVTEDTLYGEAIAYLADNGVINGYPDSSFRPKNTINRAEFVKILIEADVDDFGSISNDYDTNCFSDIPAGSWFTPYVCYAKANGIINGYPDGTFMPGSNINLVEALKIIVNVFDVQKGSEGDEWFDVYLNAMGNKNYIPNTLRSLSQKVNRGEMAEMTWRVLEDIIDLDSITPDELRDPVCQLLGEEMPNNINMDLVREQWLKWYNDARTADGKHAYVYNDQLTRTAIAWSEYSKDRGYMDHKREGQTLYYDYNMITNWFANQGLTFANVYGVTYTENIGWGPYSCNEVDCTDKLIDTIYSTFLFYMGEKNQASRAHYESLMNDYFNEIGLGIAIGNGKYYLTVHYATEITSNPLPICK